MFVRAACGCCFVSSDTGKELEVISAVQRLLNCLRSQWPTSLDHDEALLRLDEQSPTLSLRNRFALFHRIGRKRIVKKIDTAMTYLASCLQHGCRSCSREEREVLNGASCEGDSQILEALAQQLALPSHADTSIQLYSSALYSLRKSRRKGFPELGEPLPAAAARTLCGQVLDSVTFISCGQNMSACVQHGVLFSAGGADFGKLGHSKTEFDMPHQEVLFRAVPQLKNVVVVACGGNHSVCIDASATVYAWGENVFGQCGLGYSCQQVTEPRVIPVTEQFHSVVCGEAVTLLSHATQVYACGCNLEGECGLGLADTSIESPTRVPLPEDGIRKVSCRWRHAVVVMDSGDVHVWGSVDSSRLGVPAVHPSVLPKSSLTAGDSALSTGHLQRSRDSHVNRPLLLGDGDVQLPAVMDAAAGFKTSVFVTRDGAVFACGAIGPEEGELSLHLVAGLPACTRVWSGSSHGFLLARDGSLLAFGKTSAGRLGTGSLSAAKYVPIAHAGAAAVQFPDSRQVTAVACGQAHSLFILGSVHDSAPQLGGSNASLFACGRVECVAACICVRDTGVTLLQVRRAWPSAAAEQHN
jgi:alpha-tubulin suppressor-like RCC1 family protein